MVVSLLWMVMMLLLWVPSWWRPRPKRTARLLNLLRPGVLHTVVAQLLLHGARRILLSRGGWSRKALKRGRSSSSRLVVDGR